MCATCGCLESREPAPEAGVYECIECRQLGRPEQVQVQEGELMPDCSNCNGGMAHWRKQSRAQM